jgi:hypothetical protein
LTNDDGEHAGGRDDPCVIIDVLPTGGAHLDRGIERCADADRRLEQGRWVRSTDMKELRAAIRLEEREGTSDEKPRP